MSFTPLTNVDEFGGGNVQSGFSVQALFSLVNTATLSAKQKLLDIQSRRSAISIGDMFEMQMMMNHLSQLSEMSTSVVTATNTAISSMARNVKG
ncbi:MAG: hypothetical protein K940chlam7_00168 [Chlamydiae bacterium]|nr:hypothetical protein [Chlamydiota bacterium]